MKRIRLIVGVATAVALCSVIVPAVAAAKEPNLLGEKGSPPVMFKGSSGVGIIETTSGKQIECGADSPSGEFESEAGEFATKGPVNIKFEKCSFKGSTCTGSGKGEIVVSGTFQLRWWGKAITEHKVAFMTLVSKEVAFTCATASFALRGCIAGNVEPVNSGLKSTVSVLFRQEKGKQEIAEVFNAAGTEKEACKMELREGKGAFEPAGLKTTEALGSFVNKQGETINVEIMG
jgi:hypothetical protein